MSTTSTDRRIAHVPTLRGFFAFPASYQPSTIRAVDGQEDGQICSAANELAPLRERSRINWQQCVDTASDDGGEARKEQAEHDMEACLDSWDDAIRILADVCAGDDSRREALTYLETARDLAQQWGDDTEERRAIAMLSAVDA